MKYTVFDKAKWHWGAENAPTDIPQENGGTHIAFFLRWCIEQKFCSKQMWEDFPNELLSVENHEGKIDCRKLFFFDMDGVLSTEELNAKGNQFAAAYYVSEKTKFAKIFGFYLEDYTNFVKEKFDDKYFDNAYFYIENSEENYHIIKSIIDRRYEEFLEMKAKKQ